MDAINKFLGLQQPVFSETQETQTTPEQAPQQVSSTGVGSVPDAFEAFQAPALDLSPLTVPMTTPNPPPQAETVDASSLFNLLTADAGGAPSSEGEITNDASPFDPLTADVGGARMKDSVIPKPPLPIFAQDGPAKVEAIKTAESEAISQMIGTFKTSFQTLAADKEKFHQFLKGIYGQLDSKLAFYGLPAPYSEAKAEALRQRALAGDYTWLPQVQFVSARGLEGKNGTYSPGPPPTASLSERLLMDPEQAADSFIRAIGYRIDDLTNDPDILEQGIEMAKNYKGPWGDSPGVTAMETYVYWTGANPARVLAEWYARDAYEAGGNEGEAFRAALTGQPSLDKPEDGWL